MRTFCNRGGHPLNRVWFQLVTSTHLAIGKFETKVVNPLGTRARIGNSLPRTMETTAPSAFFSYSRNDSEFVLRLAEDLRAAGANVWLDQLDIEPGQRWARAVQEALTGCPLVLVVLSPSSVESSNVQDEVTFALEERKIVIPILYQDCKIPLQLRGFHYARFPSRLCSWTEHVAQDLACSAAIGTSFRCEPASAGQARATRTQAQARARKSRSHCRGATTVPMVSRKLGVGSIGYSYCDCYRGNYPFYPSCS